MADPKNDEKNDPKADPKGDPNVDPKADPKVDPNVDLKADPKTDEPVNETQLPKWAQDEFLRLRSENAGHRVDRKRAESDAEMAKRKAAEEQGKFKELYEAGQVKNVELETKLAERDLTALKTKVALEHKLPPGLAARLQGVTEEELTADAKLLLADVTPKASGRTDGAQGTGGDTPPAEMSDADKDEFAAIYGVDAAHVDPDTITT